jgi:polyhydroxyalkanoate synthesis regulator phasin
MGIQIDWMRLRRSLAILCMGLLLSLLIGLGVQVTDTRLTFAQSDTAVRAEILSLRSRVERLDSEVRRLSQSLSHPERTSGSPSPSIVNGREIGRSDPMFERLATLVIELKERIIDLEKRMTQLEQKLSR